MHLFVSLIWFGSFMLSAMAMATGAIPQAIISGAVSIVAALILRSMAPVVVENAHYRTEYHHHIHDPEHIYHDHRAQK